MTIVVGYVPTPEGEAALAQAGEEARLRAETLVVVSSTRGESGVGPVYPQTSTLMRLVADLKADGVEVEVEHRERSTDAADEILSVADAVKASLVVVGLKKRSAVGKLVLGSTAQTVMLGARCSVLGVRV
jgi:nucleotide-binding universal stress UspA family protein